MIQSSVKRLLLKPVAFKVFDLELSDWLPKRDLMIGLVLATLVSSLLSLSFPLALLQVYDRIIPNQSYSTLIYLMGAVIVALLLDMVIKLARSYVSGWADARLGFKSSYQAFELLLKCSLEEYEKQGSGVHLDRINSLDRVKDFFSGQALMILLDLPFVAIYLIIISLLAPQLVLVPILMVVLIVGLAIVYNKQIYKGLKNQSDGDERKLNYIIEVLNNIHTVKSQGMEHVMLRRFERLQDKVANDDLNVSRMNSEQTLLASLTSQMNLVLIVVLGGLLVLEQQATPGMVAACLLLSSRAVTPFVKANYLWPKFQAIKLSLDKYEAIKALPQSQQHPQALYQIEQQDICFKNVSYQHNDNSLILKGANLHIKAGEMVELRSKGALGKSTLLLLIKGIYRPQEGNVTLGGVDIHHYSETCLGKKVAYFPQEGVLFEGTILENMTLFKDKEFGERAKQLARELGLDEIIQKMPEGYQTPLSQGSVDMVSKGIKQRIILVRGMVPDPDIILFDEANSAMDVASNKRLKAWLNQFRGKKTMILVSNSPSFMASLDRTLVLHDNKIGGDL